LSGVKISTLANNGTLKLNNVAVAAGDVVPVADINSGKLTFTPAANANGNNYANFTFQVQDDGGTANGGVDLDLTPNTITFNVTPVNDAPVITVDAGDKATGTVTEIADGAPGENVNPATANGTLTLTDIDLTDVQTVSAAAKGTGYLGTFTPTITDNTTGDGKGQISWSFSLSDKDLDSLAAGKVLTQTYTITANDGQGGLANQDITITLNGTNDAPINAKAISKQTIGEGQPWQFTLPPDTFQDVDAGDKLTYTATLGNGKPLPNWLKLNHLTGELSGTPDGKAAGKYDIKIVATDTAGATANTTFNLKVLDFIGTKGKDFLKGTDDKDILQGLDGDDKLKGEEGDGCLDGGKGNDTLDGGTGNDGLNGGAGDDCLKGGDGNDCLDGGKGNDTLDGGKGHDILKGGADNDHLEGGSGNDLYVFDLKHDKGRDKIVETTKGGIDTIEFSGYGDIKIDLSQTKAQSITSHLVLEVINVENVAGGQGNDSIRGNDRDNILAGRGGNDTLRGSKGHDSFVFGDRDLTSVAALGIDKILDFAPTVDKLLLSKSTFASLATAADNPLLVKDFAIVTDDLAVGASTAAIVYNRNNGKLFYNENGIAEGLGTGGQFAALSKGLNLTHSDFSTFA
jgi:VCBS repeat-containing protein